MNKENTCGSCPHLAHGSILGTMRTAYCGHPDVEDFIVPHQAVMDGRNTIMHLTRIPGFCPRDDVTKSEKPAPRKDWVKLILK